MTADSPAGCRGPRRALLGAGQSCGRPWGLDNHASFPSALTATATSFQGREQDLLPALHCEHLPSFLSPSVHAPLPCPSTQKHGPKPSKTLCPGTATLTHLPLQCQPAHSPRPNLPRPVWPCAAAHTYPKYTPTPLHSQTATLSHLAAHLLTAQKDIFSTRNWT